MPGVKYIGPIFDGSGYAEAARNYVLSIHRQGYPVKLAPISFEKTRPDLGEDGRILASLVNNNIEYDKVIVHCTPDLWAQATRHEKGKYIIGYTVWETSKIPEVWAKACNDTANEVWVPCDWNMDVFKDSGVEVPLYKVPHAIDIPDMEATPDFVLNQIPEDTFMFYSIFQWQERKNPYGLLSAYTAAFSGVEDVVLVLKTYRADMSADKQHIADLIRDFKRFINLPHYPKIYLVVENMSKEGITALHKRGDCFTLLQRSEGWGLPHFEAAAAGKPVITPGYGGQVDFLKEDNSYLTNYTLCPVGGMTWSPYYTGDQLWCEPDIKDAMDKMRHVYDNREEAKQKGAKAREFVTKNFSWDIVGDLIVNRLHEIDQGGGHV